MVFFFFFGIVVQAARLAAFWITWLTVLPLAYYAVRTSFLIPFLSFSILTAFAWAWVERAGASPVKNMVEIFVGTLPGAMLIFCVAYSAFAIVLKSKGYNA